MAATFVRRYSDASSILALPLYNNSFYGGAHAADKLIVIDWINITMESGPGGICTFSISDATDNGIGAGSGVQFKTEISIAAGEADTVFLPFPGGYPLKAIAETITEAGGDTLSGAAIIGSGLSVGCDASAWSAYIGFHFERETNRR